jgi:hypothetical protein
MLAAAAVVALPAVARAQADARPIVAILSFDNNSIGAGRQDYDGIGKGIQETLIADMSSISRSRAPSTRPRRCASGRSSERNTLSTAAS